MTIILQFNSRRCIGITTWIIGIAMLLADHVMLLGNEIAYPARMALGCAAIYIGSTLTAYKDDFKGSMSLQMTAAAIFLLAASDQAFSQLTERLTAATPRQSLMPLLQTIIGTALALCGAALASINRTVYTESPQDDGTPPEENTKTRESDT